jgi:hypothetical protein
MSFSTPVLNPGAMGLYNQQLSLMTQNYGNILSGYSQAQQNIAGTLGGIYAGYGQAEQNVLNTLGVGNGGWGVAAPAAKQIEQSFTNTQGANQQALISAGLGNSSLLAQSNNQANLFAGQAYANLGSQLASTAAGYQTQFSLARQAAQMQGLGMQSSLAQSYLGNLAGYNFSPRIDLYGQQSDGGGGGGGGGHGGGGSGGEGSFSHLPPTPPVNASGWGYAGAYANGGVGYTGGYGNGGFGYNTATGYEGGDTGYPEDFGDVYGEAFM